MTTMASVIAAIVLASSKWPTNEKSRFKSFILLFIFLLPVSINAQRQYISYFSVGGNVCLPVTVKHQSGQFSIYNNNQRVDGKIVVREAFDCQGRRIVNTQPQSHEYETNPDVTIDHYVFSNLYQQVMEYDSDGTLESAETGGIENPVTQGATNLTNSLSNITYERWHVISDPYPNVTMQTGLSNIYGEYFRAKFCIGGAAGSVLYGGFGRDYLFDAKNEKYIGPDAKTFCWHIGLGLYLGGEHSEFALLMDYADTPLVANGSLNLMYEGSWYCLLDGHLGLFGGLGCSIGDLDAKEPKINFIFEAGIAFRFF